MNAASAGPASAAPTRELTQNILQAARSAGVTRLLQVSALKAAVDAPSYYLRTKGEAEKLIREHTPALDWTIFQPSVMFGPGDSFLNRFAGLLAAIPLVFPLARPNARLQPVLVDDVVDALLRWLHGGACSRQTYELGGPKIYTLREIVELGGETHRPAPLDHRPAEFCGPHASAWSWTSCPDVRSPATTIAPSRSTAYAARMASQGSASSRNRWQRRPAIPGGQEDNARLSQNRAAAGRSRRS